jgi:hypothetical protein
VNTFKNLSSNILTLENVKSLFDFLILRHVTRVAKYIKLKRPGIKLFIWHDMLSQLVNTGYNNVS